jgi:hypothetical protein
MYLFYSNLKRYRRDKKIRKGSIIKILYVAGIKTFVKNVLFEYLLCHSCDSTYELEEI